MDVRRALREPVTARAWRELLYCLLSLPLGLLGLAAVAATVLLGIMSAAVVIVPLLSIFLEMDRALAGVYRGAARRLLLLDVAKPVRPPRRPGIVGFLLYHLADPVGWRAFAYLAIRFPLGIAEFAAGFAPRVYGLMFALYPLISRIEPRHAVDGRGVRHTYGLAVGGYYIDTWPRVLTVVLAGLLILLAGPWIARPLIHLDRRLLVRLLGPSDTSLRIRELEETRSNAINEAAVTLRRIERDLHDGTQARLVALGMRLGRAEARLRAGDGQQAARILQEAREDTKEIIKDLRELVRGIHPPALDRGLEPALATLAARCTIPTTVAVRLPARPAASLETMLFFTAAELLANVGKHSAARSSSIEVGVTDGTLRLTVTDDGVGGAALDGSGTGLRGLAERVRTVDGRLGLSSPPGGPTVVTVEIPAGQGAP